MNCLNEYTKRRFDVSPDIKQFIVTGSRKGQHYSQIIRRWIKELFNTTGQYENRDIIKTNCKIMRMRATGYWAYLILNTTENGSVYDVL